MTVADAAIYADKQSLRVSEHLHARGGQREEDEDENEDYSQVKLRARAVIKHGPTGPNGRH